MEAIVRSVVMATVQCGMTGTAASSARRMAKRALYAIVAAVLVTASIGCASAALWIWAIPHFGRAGAPLAVAGVLLAGGLAALALMRPALRSGGTQSSSGATPELSLVDALRVFKDHQGTGLAAALVAGLMAGRNET